MQPNGKINRQNAKQTKKRKKEDRAESIICATLFFIYMKDMTVSVFSERIRGSIPETPPAVPEKFPVTLPIPFLPAVRTTKLPLSFYCLLRPSLTGNQPSEIYLSHLVF